MPRIPVSQDSVTTSAGFPKLKLETNETARICLIEPQPMFEYVHYLRAPQLVNGAPKLVWRTHGKTGEQFQDYEKDLVSSAICLGDPDVIADHGLDRHNCPVCAEAARSENFERPQRRFAVHILHYGTQQGSGQLRSPFTLECKAWAFPETRFRILANLVTEHAPKTGEFPSGDPRQLDLVLGPCRSGQFQNYEIQAGGRCEWLANDERKRMGAVAYQENHTDNLSALCGQSNSAEAMTDDIHKVKERWAIVNGTHQRNHPQGAPTPGTGQVAGTRQNPGDGAPRDSGAQGDGSQGGETRGVSRDLRSSLAELLGDAETARSSISGSEQSQTQEASTPGSEPQPESSLPEPQGSEQGQTSRTGQASSLADLVGTEGSQSAQGGSGQSEPTDSGSGTAVQSQPEQQSAQDGGSLSFQDLLAQLPKKES